MQQCKDMIIARMEKYYDCFMFDEVQDLGGHDFNLIQSIIPNHIDCLFVGDFYQHTFDTSKEIDKLYKYVHVDEIHITDPKVFIKELIKPLTTDIDTFKKALNNMIKLNGQYIHMNALLK